MCGNSGGGRGHAPSTRMSKIELVETAGVPERPVLAAGVQLAGEMSETGFVDQQWLVQRDGHFIQLSELLYRVAEQADGHHTLEEIGEAVTDATQWLVTADNVRSILRTKLIPMGLVATAEQPSSVGGQGDRIHGALRLTARTKVLSPRLIEPVSRVLQLLYTPAILLPTLALIVAAHIWLYGIHGWARAVLAVLSTPTLLLVLLAAMFLLSVFHEFGHAAALRYSGGRVRGMGVGFYLIYPAFYTDVTDSYRLGRWARVRTDLGGLYFNLIFALGVVGIYFLTRQEFLLAVVILIDLEIVQQLIPFVRFDGYWAFADLTGIADPLSQIEPFLRSVFAIPGARLARLKPWVKIAFTLYIVLTVPVLAVLLILLVKGLPLVVTGIVFSLVRQLQLLWQARTGGDGTGAILAVVQILFLALPLGGVVFVLYSTVYRWLRAMWKWAERNALRYVTTATVSAALVAVLTYFWIPQLSGAASQLAQARALLTVPSAKPIDGIYCNSMEQAVFHVHAHLAILDAGRSVRVPAGVGIKPKRGCLYWLHTHDATGIIHVEAPHKMKLTLGNFFDIWGKPLSRDRVASVRVHGGQTMRVYLNGRLYRANPRAIPLHNHTTINIEIGPPFQRPHPFPFSAFGL